MVLQTGTPLSLIGRIARQEAILGDDATLNLTVPKFASKLGFLGRRFAPLDDRRLRLKQTDDFLQRWHRLLLENSPGGLLYHATHQRHIVLQELREGPGPMTTVLAQAGLDPLDLGQHGFHELDQLAIQLFARFFGFF